MAARRAGSPAPPPGPPAPGGTADAADPARTASSRLRSSRPGASRPGGADGSLRSAGPQRAAVQAGLAALVCAAALAAATAWLPLSHDDLFLHLETGEWIVEHRAVPTTDPFSHTRAGERWVTHEWAFSLLVWAGERLGGLGALSGLKLALALALWATVAATAWRAARRSAPHDPAAAATPFPPALLVAPLVALAVYAVSLELILRAALAGALCFALLVLLLPRFAERPGWRRGAPIVPLVLLWANLHSGVIFGLFLLGLAAAEGVVRGRRQGAGSGARPSAWLALAAAAGLAALVNPNGLEALLYPLRLAALLSDPASGFTRGHFAGGWSGREALLALLAAAALAGLLLARRRGLGAAGERWPAFGWIALVVFAALSLRTARVGIELAVLAVPATAAAWAPLLAALPAARRAGWAFAAVVSPVALVLAVLIASHRPPGAVSPAFPEDAVGFLAEHGVRGRLFHHQNWGGYLAWRLGVPLFWDGRNDVFAPLVRELATTPFAEVARRHRVGTLLLSGREVEQLAAELASGRWQLAWHDERSAVFYARRPETATGSPPAAPAILVPWQAPAAPP
ncbi:MAG TPA: hypothetical protein VHQ65_04005 [Thermoanaerobaculia bacterium]|nr:hypothetical protein [Thermoanaerobaculia bacterium]